MPEESSPGEHGFFAGGESQWRRRFVWGCVIAPLLGAAAVVVAFLLRTCAERDKPIIDLGLPFVMIGVFVGAAVLALIVYLLICAIPSRGMPVLGFVAAVCAAAFVARFMAFLGLGGSILDSAHCVDWVPWW